VAPEGLIMAGKKGRSGRRSKASLCIPIPPLPWTSPTTGEPLTRAPTVYEFWEFKRQLVTNRGHMPDDLFDKLNSLFNWLISREPWPMEMVHNWRRSLVIYGLREGHKLIDDSAYEYAAKEAAGTPARGDMAAMKDSYFKFEKRLRAGLIRHRPHQ
jgi:hypothetical protein